MKTNRILLIVLAVLCLPLACEKSADQFTEGVAAVNLKCGDRHHHVPDQDRYVTMRSTGLRVHYRIIGNGPVTIVFIPGWTNPLEIFTRQFDYFRDKARCIYIDVPGQGLSDAPEGIQYTMGMMADAIYDVVRKEGVRRFVAVGFSMGPVPLGQFHLRHPGMITKLVNLDGSFYPWPADPAEKEAYGTWLDEFCTGMETWGEPEKAAFASQLVTDSSPQDLLDLIDYFLVFPSPLMSNIFRNIMTEDVNQAIGWTFPILSIYSISPANMDYEQLYFPNADIHVLEGGHVVQWEQADIVNELIRDFALGIPGRH
jgi:pimeloyl-ACP methyl ester carboxylesterase